MRSKIGQNFLDFLRRKKSFSECLLAFYSKKDPKANTILNIFYEIKKNKFKIKKLDLKNKNIIFTNKKISVCTDFDYPYIIEEIFGLDIYKFKSDIDTTKKYTVLDIGANRGYASLYFASQPWCKDVSAFELVQQTADYAIKNFELNSSELRDKIHMYNFGLGKEDKELVYYTDGRDYAISMCKEALLKTCEDKNNIKENYAKVKKASTMLRKIIEENNIDSNIILKIDVEGAEYDIFDDLIENYPEIFDKTVKIIGETHLGFDSFYDKIKNFNYKIIWKEPHDNGTCPFELSKKG